MIRFKFFTILKTLLNQIPALKYIYGEKSTLILQYLNKKVFSISKSYTLALLFYFRE